MLQPLTHWKFLLVIGTFIVVQLCVMLMMPLQTIEMSADNLAFPRMMPSIQPIEYSNDAAYQGAFRWSLTRNTERLFGRAMPVAQVLSIYIHHGRSMESPVVLELTQRKTTQTLMLPSGWRRISVLVFADDSAGVYREIDLNINAEPIVSDRRELGVAVRDVKLTDTTLNPLFWASLLRFLYVGLLWLWVVIICYWRRWPWWSALILPSVVLATLWFAPLLIEMYIPSDWSILWLGYGALAILWLCYRLAMVVIPLWRVSKHQYKLPILALCFLISVSSNLIFNPKSVALDALAWICTVALVAVVLGLTFPRSAHLYLLFVVLGYLAVGVGLVESAFVLLWLASSWSLGVLILGRLYSKEHLSLISATTAVLIGAVIWIAIWGVMLHFAVNYQSLHTILCLLPCLLMANRFSSIRDEVRAGVVAVQDWLHSIPFLAWAVGVAVIGWILRWDSLPSVGFDDHVYHLRMWTELLTQHRYSFDFTSQIWSSAPFTVDLLHAGLSLMAGADARGAMNLGLTVLLLLLMVGILRTWKLPAWTQWLLIVLMASTPMLGYLLLNLHTELMLAVIALAGMRLVIDAHGGLRGQHIIGVLSCAALCASIKLPGAVLGATLLVALVVRWWSNRDVTTLTTSQLLCWPSFILLIPISFVALHSYVTAWVLTGNPVFPLLNNIFLSSYSDPVNIGDGRWVQGFSIISYVSAFLNTSKFFEGGDYTAGWQYLIVLPLAIFTLIRSGTPRGLRILLIPILGFGLAMFYTTQYWRYLFPVMPLAVVLFGSLFIQEKPVLRNMAFILSLACIAANLLFFTRVTSLMNHPAWMGFTREGKKTYTSLYAPTALLTERVNILAPGSRVLYTFNKPYGATLHGTPIYINQYQPFREKAFSAVKDFDGLRNFLSKEKIDFVILDMYDIWDLQHVLLREYMAQYGYVESQESEYLLYRISDAPVQYRKVFALHPSEAEELGNSALQILKTDQGVIATAHERILAVMPTLRAKQARYKVEIRCPSKSGYFVAKINWDKGPSYYRRVACEARNVTFIEAIPIPTGASHGSIYISARGTPSIQVKNITVEVN